VTEATSGTTVGVKTFLRTDKLTRCLGALAKHGWHEVIVADDGWTDDARERLYTEFARRLPLKLLRLPFDTGLAAGRNEIVRQCRTELLLMLDDDQTVPDNIGVLREILDERHEVGGVSCVWREAGRRKCSACDIRRDGRRLIKEVAGEKPILTTSGGRRYALFDFVPNSTLFRMACLRDQSWDPFYKIGKEHLDFYLRHQELGRWKFAVCLDVEIRHHPEGSSAEYDRFRHGERVRASERYFQAKFGVSRVTEGRKFIDGGHRSLLRSWLPGLWRQ
jgi:GT2 family glycosyltransferase